MYRKLFVFFSIALIGFALCVNFIGCKKESPMDEQTMEEDEEAEEDME